MGGSPPLWLATQSPRNTRLANPDATREFGLADPLYFKDALNRGGEPGILPSFLHCNA